MTSTGSKAYDLKRREEKPWRGWYSTARWRSIRRHQLTFQPLCAMCTKDGRVVAATVCDHVMPHKGNPVLFWKGPFQSLCEEHHSKHKQREELGLVQSVDDDGWPLR